MASHARCVERIARLGQANEVLPLPGSKTQANLLASLEQGSGELVLAGHTDKLYGLGAADMKGFLALAVEAAARDSEPLILGAPRRLGGSSSCSDSPGSRNRLHRLSRRAETFRTTIEVSGE